MKTMVIHSSQNRGLVPMELKNPVPSPDQVLIRVQYCGVCHTELDELEGRCLPSFFPIIPGHQIVGTIEGLGDKVYEFKVGQRVGVAWIYSACGNCDMCLNGYENLCPDFMATGKDAHGGYAEYMVAPAKFVYFIPQEILSEKAAPLLCAGAIGYRSLSLTNIKKNQILGLSGFGSSAHLVIQMIKQQKPEIPVFVWARSPEEREYAEELGASWTGDFFEIPPTRVGAIIDTTPVWNTVVSTLEYLQPGGRLVINAIRKEEGDKSYLNNLDYIKHLWMEKEIKSVANVTRKDVFEFLKLASRLNIEPEIEEFPLREAAVALLELKKKGVRGSKVLNLQ